MVYSLRQLQELDTFTHHSVSLLSSAFTCNNHYVLHFTFDLDVSRQNLAFLSIVTFVWPCISSE